MKFIGFSFTKIIAEKNNSYKKGSSINTNIEFTNIVEQKLEILKEGEGLEVSYKFSVNYSDPNEKKQSPFAQIECEGKIVLSTTKEESKEILKFWKKKELPNQFKVPLFNAILKRCTTKAITLEEDLGLPSHIPFPQIALEKKK